MLVTNHVLAGALIGATVRKPALALVLGIGSHVAMDVTPHWGLPHGKGLKDPEFLRVAYRDGLAGLAAMGAVYALARGRRLPVLAGMVGAALLDVDKPSRHFLGRSPFPATVDRLHAEIQVGREHAHRMGQEVAVATGLAVAATFFCRRR